MLPLGWYEAVLGSRSAATRFNMRLFSFESLESAEKGIERLVERRFDGGIERNGEHRYFDEDHAAPLQANGPMAEFGGLIDALQDAEGPEGAPGVAKGEPARRLRERGRRTETT